MGHKSNDLVIVSSGALLPGAANPQEFFESLLAGVCHVHDLREAEDLMFRPLYDLIYDSDRKSTDTSYSTMGADIPRQKILALAEKHGLNLRTSVVLHVMVVEAVHQCIGQILDANQRARTDFIFGSGDSLAGTLGSRLIDVFDEVAEAFKESEHWKILEQACLKERRRFAPDSRPAIAGGAFDPFEFGRTSPPTLFIRW